jgi:uncharacterized small protein (DUF1192 family)
MIGGKSNTPDRVRELEAACAMYASEIGRLEARVGELGSETGRLQAELQQKRGVRAAAHGLYRALDDSIIARIDRRGFIAKPKKRTMLPISDEVLASDDPQALMALAQQYDTAAYFRYRASSSGMRLRYRVASKVYRLARDTALFGLKKTYRLARKAAK